MYPGAATRPPSFRADIFIVTALAVGPLIGLGLARFAYALLLPAMRSELGWSFATAGLVGTANGVGYLIGAIIAAPLASRYGLRKVFIASLAIVVVGLFLSAASGLLSVIIAVRLMVGVAGAVCFVVGGGLAAEVGRSHARSRATWLLAVYFAGSGLGIVASGIAVPAVLASASATMGWRIGWLLLAGIGVVASAAALGGVLRAPEPRRSNGVRQGARLRSIQAVLLSYFLYGTGYISYMTFIVAFLAERGADPGQIAVFWIVLGACSVAATFLWGPLLARLQGGRGVAVVLAFVTIGAVIPILSDSLFTTFASAILFGGSFLSVVTAVTSAARQALPPRHWTSAIGSLTVAFALGQCIGPILTGAIADSHDGVAVGLAVSGALLALASLTALVHRDPVEPPTIE